jgi:hypothetical protein
MPWKRTKTLNCLSPLTHGTARRYNRRRLSFVFPDRLAGGRRHVSGREMMQEQAFAWFIIRDGQQHGPVSEQEMQAMIARGLLKPTDMVWRDGFADWQPCHQAFRLAQPAPPPIPQPRHTKRPPRSREGSSRPRRFDHTVKPQSPLTPPSVEAVGPRRPTRTAQFMVSST